MQNGVKSGRMQRLESLIGQVQKSTDLREKLDALLARHLELEQHSKDLDTDIEKVVAEMEAQVALQKDGTMASIITPNDKARLPAQVSDAFEVN